MSIKIWLSISILCVHKLCGNILHFIEDNNFVDKKFVICVDDFELMCVINFFMWTNLKFYL